MYLKKTYRYNNIIEIEKTCSGRYGRKLQVSEKKNVTKESQRKENERQMIKKLNRIIEANFGDDDYHLVLTYTPDNRPEPQDAKKILKDFFTAMRKEYKVRNCELKYIVVTEYRKKAIHHHVVINELPQSDPEKNKDHITLMKLLKRHWKHGRKMLTALYGEGEYENLAAYLVKETTETFKDDEAPCKKRYSCSRNLVHPEPEVKIIKAFKWAEDPKPKKGYEVIKDSVHSGINRMGFPYQYYKMRKINNKDDNSSLYFEMPAEEQMVEDAVVDIKTKQTKRRLRQ